ncbi:Gfo/Idh/MocA family protein [Nakamurella multipartita]|uniref:Oxidoreductase domain protein n=1 Tax=Nakamurella multipartita (strain ATCC 700099 / DSM 44233 / CIP 104796 / JCM 9543 / NBRC 105858 / Y-104) TaxID=479431 RepID=C8XHU1_NAKMY|nr:Gfo/Idh/MocA family oxidoreductase [Nakamurella multipartita]ACV80394.1 oxidoreductase domain protein [Nakamurella multipartita DSM 44233]
MIRWGLIGGSDIAATRMIPALRALGQSPVAVSSSSAERAELFAGRHEIAHACRDVDELLARDDIDAVYISSLNRLHAEHTIAAAAAGKHVLCEKPVALDVADAAAMVAACDRAAVVFAVNHHLPAHTSNTVIRQLVADGAVGEVRSIRAFFAYELAPRLRGWRLTDPAVGGPILDLVPHVASVVNKIAGTPSSAVAIAVRQGTWDGPAPDGAALPEDTCMAVVRYPDDVLVQIHVGWATPHARNGLEVNGSTGSVVGTGVLWADPIGAVTVVDSDGRREIALEQHVDPYQETLSAFARAVTDGTPPVVSGREAATALALTLAVRRAAASGTTEPVELASP